MGGIITEKYVSVCRLNRGRLPVTDGMIYFGRKSILVRYGAWMLQGRNAIDCFARHKERDS